MKFWLLAATALVSGPMIATIAHAQTTADDTAQKVGPSEAAIAATLEGDRDVIIVTGSRIRRPNLESTVPIVSIAGAEFFETGAISVGDTLNDLPQLRSTYSQQNSTRFLGTRGLNLLDLRGLGTSRTLVLVNGRRHVPGDVLNNAVSPDVNTFPTDLIERVDIVTGGNSSIYGSDAIAGVVNFILKDSYDGFQIRGQSGISKYGDAANQYVSALFGKNFADGRGNIAINAEYAKSDRYFGSGRPNLSQNDTFIVVDTDPAGSVNGSDGVPDRTFFRDVRSATISPGGQTGIFYGAAAPGSCGVDAVGAAFVCNSLFQRDGTLIPQTGTRVGLAPNGVYTGGNGQTGRDGALLTLTPSLERISINMIGRFEISPAFVPFFEAKYVRSDAFGSVSGPFFSQGGTLGDALGRERPRLDNPFLTAQARAVLTPQLLASTVNANTGGALTPAQLTAQRAAIADGSFRFNVRRNYVDLGIRDEKFRRETYRAVAGVRGEFNDDWNYELSANYGEHRENNVIESNVNRQRFLLAVDTTRNAAGQIVCRSQIDPAAVTPDRGKNPAILAADIAACVPLNPFGEGSISQAAKNYLTISSNATGKITQFVGSGFVAGDLSQIFELPGGPIGFSVGAEYRRERVNYDLDDLTQAGYAFYNAIPTFTAPAFEVKELFGEISVPLVKDVFLLKELTLTGSARVSDYTGPVGTVYTYAGGVDYRPIEDLRIRAAYSRAIRAPNLSELYSSQSQNFAPAPNDPCSARNLATGSATRSANCTAAGRPANYDFVYTSSLEIISGGNPALKEEKSTSYTIGGVFQPRFVPGLSLSVDYYNIKVENVITSVSAQQILNSCYDAASLDNPFCALVQRAGQAGGPRGETQFRVLEGTLLASTLNFAKRAARGVDTELAFRRSFGWGSAGFRATWTHTLERSDFENPADPGRANRIVSELGDPKNQVNFTGDVKFGDITFGYQVRWLDKAYLNTYEDYNELQGRPPENADYADLRQYPAVFYHDIRIGVDVGERFNIYAGVDNVGNQQPPYGLTGVGGGSGIYDLRGRYGYIGFVAKF
jgi:outer membrane receptor protein involved in Fe transport